MGAHDLDAEYWEGWFDSDVQDSGAIMVGGSYGLGDLAWSGGSSYGSRMDVQGWFDRIVTTSTYEFADLFYPEDTDKPTRHILVEHQIVCNRLRS